MGGAGPGPLNPALSLCVVIIWQQIQIKYIVVVVVVVVVVVALSYFIILRNGENLHYDFK